MKHEELEGRTASGTMRRAAEMLRGESSWPTDRSDGAECSVTRPATD